MKLELAGWDEAWSKAFEPHASAGLLAGRVFSQKRDFYSLYTEAGETDTILAGSLLYRADEGSLPVVGDWVAYRQHAPDDLGLIHDVLPRRTKFSRNRAGRGVQEQLIAANIDVLFVICGLDRDYNVRRLERYLVAAGGEGVSVVVVLNKTDLCADLDARLREVRAIAQEVPVLAISALMPGAATALQPYLRPGQTGALVGSSGAGKSTIVNQLVATACQPTQATRSTDGRGRHTTSNRELFLLPTGGLILDNPGMRELQLWPEQASLYSAFPEIEEIARRCAFRDCSHQGDQGCAIAEELANGRLDTERWRSYLKLRRELRHISLEADIHARQQEKRRIKKLCKDVKRLAERERGYR